MIYYSFRCATRLTLQYGEILICTLFLEVTRDSRHFRLPGLVVVQFDAIGPTSKTCVIEPKRPLIIVLFATVFCKVPNNLTIGPRARPHQDNRCLRVEIILSVLIPIVLPSIWSDIAMNLVRHLKVRHTSKQCTCVMHRFQTVSRFVTGRAQHVGKQPRAQRQNVPRPNDALQLVRQMRDHEQ